MVDPPGYFLVMDGWMDGCRALNERMVMSVTDVPFRLNSGPIEGFWVRGVRYWGFACPGRCSGSGVTLVAPSLRTGVERDIAPGGEKGPVSHRQGTGRVRFF